MYKMNLYVYLFIYIYIECVCVHSIYIYIYTCTLYIFINKYLPVRISSIIETGHTMNSTRMFMLFTGAACATLSLRRCRDAVEAPKVRTSADPLSPVQICKGAFVGWMPNLSVENKSLRRVLLNLLNHDYIYGCTSCEFFTGTGAWLFGRKMFRHVQTLWNNTNWAGC